MIRMPGQRLSDYRQPGRLIQLQILPVQDEAIHRRIVVRRHIEPGQHIGGQHPAAGVEQRRDFDLPDRLDGGKGGGAGFGERQQAVFGVATVGHSELHQAVWAVRMK